MNISMCRQRYCTQSTIRKIYISSNEKHCTKDCGNCYPLRRVHDTFADTWASFLCTLAYCANNKLRIITFFIGGSVLSSWGDSGWLANMPDYKSSGQGSTPWRSTVEGCFFWGGFLQVDNFTDLSVPVSPSHAQHALRSLRTSNIPRPSFDGQWQGNTQIMRNSDSTIRMTVAPNAGRKKAGCKQKMTLVVAASTTLAWSSGSHSLQQTIIAA